MQRNIQPPLPPRLEVAKVYPQRGKFCLYRLSKLFEFECNRCGGGKTSKLVAFTEDKWEEPVCNGCYGYLLAALDADGGAKDTQDASVDISTRTKRSHKIRRAKKSTLRQGKSSEATELQQKAMGG